MLKFIKSLFAKPVSPEKTVIRDEPIVDTHAFKYALMKSQEPHVGFSEHEIEVARMRKKYPAYDAAYVGWQQASKAKKKGSAAKAQECLEVMIKIRNQELLGEVGFK